MKMGDGKLVRSGVRVQVQKRVVERAGRSLALLSLLTGLVGQSRAAAPWTHPDPYSLTGHDPLAYERWRLELALHPEAGDLAVPTSRSDSLDALPALSLQPVVSGSARLVSRPEDRPLVGSGGIYATGALPSLRFSTDARIFAERREADRGYSLDREFIEVETDGNYSNFGYVTYARYRSALDIDLPFGLLGLRRDALQVGPGHAANLMHNPIVGAFPYAFFTGSIGAFRVTSLFGTLSIDGDQQMRVDRRDRNLFVHRYEWTGIPALRIGITENLVVVDGAPLEGFLPVAPLFMTKGQAVEDDNNGNLAFDFAWSPGRGPWSLYGEFLVDDVSEPTSLFNDYWKNRWAAMAGVSRSARWGADGLWGGAIEAYRIEPWVYGHYRGGAAAAAHRGIPIGGLTGANSMGLAQSIWVGRDAWSVRGTWLVAEKGLDRGSSLRDTMPQGLVAERDTIKSFLGGPTEVVHDWSVDLSWRHRGVVLSGRAAWSRGLVAGLTATWFLPSYIGRFAPKPSSLKAVSRAFPAISTTPPAPEGTEATGATRESQGPAEAGPDRQGLQDQLFMRQ